MTSAVERVALASNIKHQHSADAYGILPTAHHPHCFNRGQGCVVIFMSYFLALLIKMGAAGEANRSALGGFLVVVNVFLVLAVLSAAWVATRRMGDNSHEEGNTSGK